MVSVRTRVPRARRQTVTEEDHRRWKEVYRRGGQGPYPWDLGRPREFLVQLFEEGLIKGEKALDTCCGLGTNGLYLAEKGFHVTGIDISEDAVAMANRSVREAGKEEEVRFQVQSFMDMDFPDENFDFVLDIGCFHHVREGDRRKFIENLQRVLRPGGRYLLMCFSASMGPAWNHFSEQQVRDLFYDRFRILRLEEISSLEGDGVSRAFHVSLMERRL
jgi:ubiquinone/menaquinone biosynthesis C-methylase UbiE